MKEPTIQGHAERTEAGIYHIHIDATKMPAAFIVFSQRDLGFSETNFSGHPEGYRHFEPRAHLTLKLRSPSDFKNYWEALEKEATETGFLGYLEGEYIVSDEAFPFKEYDDNVQVPFRIERRRLRGPPDEEFRQTELHLVMDKDNSDKRLITKLLDSGLYGAYIPKQDHIALVLTAQGFRKDVSKLKEAIKKYVEETGGVARCTLKEERAIKHMLFGITHEQLPEIADKIILLD